MQLQLKLYDFSRTGLPEMDFKQPIDPNDIFEQPEKEDKNSVDELTEESF